MSAIRTILHPTDFSQSSEYAFELACSLARVYGSQVIVIHVAQPSITFGGGIVVAPPEDHKESLREKLNRLRLMGSVAEQVVRKAACPVLTVKRPLAETQPSAVASETASAPASTNVTKG